MAEIIAQHGDHYDNILYQYSDGTVYYYTNEIYVDTEGKPWRGPIDNYYKWKPQPPLPPQPNPYIPEPPPIPGPSPYLPDFDSVTNCLWLTICISCVDLESDEEIRKQSRPFEPAKCCMCNENVYGGYEIFLDPYEVPFPDNANNKIDLPF